MKDMNSLKKTLAFLTAAISMAAWSAGCSAQNTTERTNSDSSVSEEASSEEESSASLSADTLSNQKTSDSELFSERDLDPSYDEVNDTITLGNESVTITEEGVYLIKGTLKDGQIIVNAPKAKVQLVLDGADITCSDSTAVYVQDADKVFITLAEGSNNTVSDGKEYKDADNENSPSAAIFSEDSITINGSGSLTVNGNYKNGIQSKDDIVITGGTIIVNAANDGIKAKDYIAVADGDITVNAEGDGIKSTNAEDEGMGFVYIEGGIFGITSSNDGIQAETQLNIIGGTFDITTGGGYENSTNDHNDNFGFGGGQGGFGGFGEMPNGFDDNNNSERMPNFRGRGNKSDENNTEDNPFSGRENTHQNSSPTLLANKTITEDATSEESTSDSTKGLKAGDAINITGGTFTIDSADDAIHSNGNVDITGGTFSISAGDDGIHSDDTVNIGIKAADTFDDVQVFIANCYEGIEGATINQNSGTVYIISGDDGFNASGGEPETNSDSGFGHGMMETSTGTININGGLAVVNSANGDHDGFDSNGDVNLNGGYICANGMDPIDCGDNGGHSINFNGTSVITMAAGNTGLSQRYSFVDKNGNVIVSFMSANGPAGQNCTDCTAYSGGTVSGGKEILSQADKYSVTMGGKLSDGEEITSETETSMMFGGNGGGFKPFGKNEMPDGMKPPTDENGNIQMPDGFTPPTGEDGRPQKPQSGHGRLQQPTEEDSEN